MQRPPHIDPQRWARAPWIAQQKAEREYRATQRVRTTEPAVEPYEPAPLPRAWVERVPLVEEMLDAGRTPEQIADVFGIQLQPAGKGLVRAGRPDLAKPFRRAEHEQEKHPCADCPTLVRRQSTRCLPCASAKPRSGRGEVAA